MIDDKVSKYNFEVEHGTGILLYNAMTDKILPISFEDYAVIETLMDHLPVFSEKFPDLYAIMKKWGFITDVELKGCNSNCRIFRLLRLSPTNDVSKHRHCESRGTSGEAIQVTNLPKTTI